jgi:2-polyprenyl-3-methyl-5-hydroxy-6-metoxy-1,4-benzoquinol methylase
MDQNKLKKAVQALDWENRYRKRFKDEALGAKSFLSIQPGLDFDFDNFFDKYNIHGGSLLDIGTGTGEQSIYLANKGFNVTAIDASASAIASAKELATRQDANVEFITDSILSTKLKGEFDIIVDIGCFALIPAAYKEDYRLAVKTLLKPGGWFLIKADKKKENALQIFKDDKSLIVKVLKDSSYERLNSKKMEAVFMACQKIG